MKNNLQSLTKISKKKFNSIGFRSQQLGLINFNQKKFLKQKCQFVFT